MHLRGVGNEREKRVSAKFWIFSLGEGEAKSSVYLPCSINSGYKCGIIQLSVHFRTLWNVPQRHKKKFQQVV